MAMESSFLAFLTDNINPLMATPFAFTNYSQKDVKHLSTLHVDVHRLKKS